MEQATMMELLKTFGLGVFLSIAILSIAWYLLRKTFENHSKERDIWLKMADTHFKQQEEGHSRQRQEHEKILNGLQEVSFNLRAMNGKN